MAGDLNLSMVIRASAGQAHQELGTLDASLKGLGAAAEATRGRATGAVQFGAAARTAAANTAQLGFQLNDIAMMLAAGQSPFLLMLQQGPQVTQVMGQMRSAGLSLGAALRSALLGMLNPASLATMAVIGLGAALVQRFMEAGEAAAPLEDRVGDLDAAVTALARSNERARATLAGLAGEFGRGAGEARELYAILARIQALQAGRALAGAMSAAVAEFGPLAEMLAEIDAALAEAGRVEARIAGAEVEAFSRSRLPGRMQQIARHPRVSGR